MNKRIVFRNMDHSDVMQEYANQQLAKIEEFLAGDRGPVSINLYFEPSRVHKHHRIELHVTAAEYDLNSSYEHEGDEFYDTLDRVIDVMYKKLHEAKRRKNDEKVSCGRHDEFKKQR